MKKTNCPEVKNNKRKVALANLEKQIQVCQTAGDKPNSVKRIALEITTLKARIIG